MSSEHRNPKRRWFPFALLLLLAPGGVFAGATVSDDGSVTSAAVAAALRIDPQLTPSSSLRVSVAGGRAALSGTAASSAQLQRAIAVTRLVPGVSSVSSTARAVPGTGNSSSFSEVSAYDVIAAAGLAPSRGSGGGSAKSVLSAAGLSGIDVDTEGDAVVLRGRVSSRAAADRAVALVSALPGVRLVRDELRHPGSLGYASPSSYSSRSSASRYGGERGVFNPPRRGSDTDHHYHARSNRFDRERPRGFWSWLFGGPAAWGWGAGDGAGWSERRTGRGVRVSRSGGGGSYSGAIRTESGMRRAVALAAGNVKVSTQTIVHKGYRYPVRRASLTRYDYPVVSALVASTPRGGLRQLGGPNAFCRGGVDTVADLQDSFRTMRGDYETILRKAGWDGNPQDLFQAVADGKLYETQFDVGTHFKWMALRKNGKPMLGQDLTWEGKKPIDAFHLLVDSHGLRHSFAIPKVCCNLALIGAGPIPTTPPTTTPTTTPTKPQTRPHAKLQVTPGSTCVTSEVLVDASASWADHGDLDGVMLAVEDPGGRRELPAAYDRRWRVRLERPGTYRFTAVSHSGSARSEPVVAVVKAELCPPTCDIQAIPSEVYAGEPFQLDGSSSSAQVGELRSVSVVLSGDAGQPGDDIELSSSLETPFVAPMEVRAAGRYVLTGVGRDSLGQESAACTATLEVLPRVGIFAGPLIGLERRWRGGEFDGDVSSPLVGSEVGVRYRAGKNLELAAVAGGALNTSHSENSSLFADVEANVVGHGFFVGTGLGLWDLNNSDSNDTNLLLQAGVDLPLQVNESPVQWLMQGRLFLDMMDHIDNNYLVWSGLRIPLTRHRKSTSTSGTESWPR